jgi:hypothetical protein
MSGAAAARHDWQGHRGLGTSTIASSGGAGCGIRDVACTPALLLVADATQSPCQQDDVRV